MIEPQPGEVWREVRPRRAPRNLVVLEVLTDGSTTRYARLLAIPFTPRRATIRCRNGVSKTAPRWKEVWIRLGRFPGRLVRVASAVILPPSPKPAPRRGSDGRFSSKRAR